MKNPRLAQAVETVMDAADRVDPTRSTPVLDLHHGDGRHTGYCLVRSEWLDGLYGYGAKAEPEIYPPELIPHDHIDPSEEQ